MRPPINPPAPPPPPVPPLVELGIPPELLATNTTNASGLLSIAKEETLPGEGPSPETLTALFPGATAVVPVAFVVALPLGLSPKPQSGISKV